ncbi:MAG TPA: TIGR03617 family F420-dependent LLM class oxidoreductase, partial [Acidimicrobiales bacterium]|nr:TIGR03617 family F420-dependent LLM class oxidoreductase [Acidimicrobiales bacterium]
MKIDGYLGGSLDEAPRRATTLEALGYDGAFSAEGPHEPFLPLVLAAEHTTRLELMTNIAVAFARSPMDLAQLANDAQLVAGGRFILGVGSQIRPHIEKRFSMPWSHPARRMRELVLAVKAIQQCWQTGEALAFRGEFYQHTLMTPFFSPGPNPSGPPPIFVAGLGPLMTEVAAEVGDGLLIHPFHSGQFVRDVAASAVDRGLARAGRDRRSFTLAATIIVATGSDDEAMGRAQRGVRRLLAFYGSTPAYRVVLDAHGWGDLQAELNTLSKRGQWEEMGSLIPDEVYDALVVTGRPAEIA